MTAMEDNRALGTAAGESIAPSFLLIAVVGSGIAAKQLSAGNAAVALLANAVATGAALFALILVFGPVSGAQMNPAVTVALARRGGQSWAMVPGVIAAQTAGGLGGIAIAHLMFELPAVQLSQHVRTGFGQWLAEAVATLGLLGVVFGCARRRDSTRPDCE